MCGYREVAETGAAVMGTRGLPCLCGVTPWWTGTPRSQVLVSTHVMVRQLQLYVVTEVKITRPDFFPKPLLSRGSEDELQRQGNVQSLPSPRISYPVACLPQPLRRLWELGGVRVFVLIEVSANCVLCAEETIELQVASEEEPPKDIPGLPRAPGREQAAEGAGPEAGAAGQAAGAPAAMPASRENADTEDLERDQLVIPDGQEEERQDAGEEGGCAPRARPLRAPVVLGVWASGRLGASRGREGGRVLAGGRGAQKYRSRGLGAGRGCFQAGGPEVGA